MRTARDHLFAHPGAIVCEHRIHKSQLTHAASFYSEEYHLARKWQCEPWSAPVSCDRCNGLHSWDQYARILCAFSVESPPRDDAHVAHVQQVHQHEVLRMGGENTVVKIDLGLLAFHWRDILLVRACLSDNTTTRSRPNGVPAGITKPAQPRPAAEQHTALKNKEYQARKLWDVGNGDICDLANGEFAARQAARHGETNARQHSAEHDLTHAAVQMQEFDHFQ